MTDKAVDVTKNSRLIYTMPYALGIILSVIGIIRLVGLSGKQQTATYCVILFWLCLNLYFMIMAFYVALGRKIAPDYFAYNKEQSATDELKKKGLLDESITTLLNRLTEG